ncbi:MAG: hypothetical protein R3Y36_06090 [Spirochaetales bacterium]
MKRDDLKQELAKLCELGFIEQSQLTAIDENYFIDSPHKEKSLQKRLLFFFGNNREPA